MIQILANAVIYAAEISIIAVGVALTYSILRFANFAHIQFAVIGGYLTYTFYALVGLPLVVAALISAVVTGGLAVLVDRIVYRRLRATSPEGKMIVSWGIALFLRSIVAAIFGGAALVFDVTGDPIRILGATVTTLDILVVATTLVAMVVLHTLLFRTRLGTALRALASNRDLAETRGIPAEAMTALMWFVVGAFAAIGGTLFALETRLQPNMDLVILLPVFAAVTIGGLGNVFGAAAGAFILSLAQNLLIGIDFGQLAGGAPWYVPTQFRDAIAVGALVLVLIFRPRQARGVAAR